MAMAKQSSAVAGQDMPSSGDSTNCNLEVSEAAGKDVKDALRNDEVRPLIIIPPTVNSSWNW